MNKDYTIVETIRVTRIFHKELLPDCFKPSKNPPAEYIDMLKKNLNADDVEVVDEQIFEHSDESEYTGEEVEVSAWYLNSYGSKVCAKCYCKFPYIHDSKFCPKCGRYLMRGDD